MALFSRSRWLLSPMRCVLVSNNGTTTNAEGAKFNRAALLANTQAPMDGHGADGDRYAEWSKSIAASMWTVEGSSPS